ncbi:MAG TPA: hypothetical protein VK879_17535 [Candidatus Sulfomarinibacteraceae bacterium]|nr:hypothetical protein [Candidatus Sulfomarinibacteraceae bacterium]
MVDKRQRTVFAGLFLATGAALVVYVISGVSLLAAAGLALTIALVAGALLWQRAGLRGRQDMRRCLQAGVVAGFLATSAYDLSRFFLIEVTGIAFWPFDIFNIFGQALFGAGYSGAWVRLAGLVYHFANGIGFALAYTILAGRRGVWAGVVWAMILELLMVTIYPGWLGLEALNEFVQVSVIGHIVYGAVLGYSARWLLIYLEGHDGSS